MRRIVTQGWHDHRSRHIRTPEHRLLLLLSASSAARARDAALAEELAARSDPQLLLTTMRRQRLLSLLGGRLIELVPEALDADARALVEDHHDRVAVQTTLQNMALGRMLNALREHEIPVATLKGPRFAESVHRDAGARPSGDLDVLVPPGRLADAQAAIAPLGWRDDRGDLRDRAGLPLLHVASEHAGDLPTVEFHWRVHWYETSFAQEALERSRRAGSDRLQPVDELLALLLYVARDGLAGLRLVVDTVTWLERHDDGPLNALPALVDRHPELRRAADAALRVVLDVEGLGRTWSAPRGVRSRFAAAVADPLLLMPAKQTAAERTLVDILLAPRAWEAVRRQLIPSRKTLRAWADHQSERPNGRAVAAHTVRSLRRYALAGLHRVPTATRPSA